MVPFGFIILLSGFIFYAYDFETPSVWMAVYAACSKNLWGIVIAIIIIGFSRGLGSKFVEEIVKSLAFYLMNNLNFNLDFILKFMNSSIFKLLGKITYSIYLCHTVIIRILVGDIRQPSYVSDVKIVKFF